VRGSRDARERLCIGLLVEPQLEDADRFATTGHWRVDTRGTLFSADLHLLLGQRAPVRSSGHWNCLGPLATEGAAAAFHMAQADERLTAEVGDQEADVARLDHVRQCGADHLGGRDRRRCLDSRKQFTQVQSRARPVHAGGPYPARRLRTRRA
jgi:hypothetical protein